MARAGRLGSQGTGGLTAACLDWLTVLVEPNDGFGLALLDEMKSIIFLAVGPELSLLERLASPCEVM